MYARSEPFGIEWRDAWSPRHPAAAAGLARLPVLQRLLLTTDGTVTIALETLMGEPIGVRTLDQRAAVLEHDDGELTLKAGDSVIERRTLLYGAQSGTPLLYGASRIVPHRLPCGARDALIDGDQAIGVVLQALKLETFRVPLRLGVLAPSDGAIPHLGSGLMCRRRYVINSGGQALMVIDEQFPAAGFV